MGRWARRADDDAGVTLVESLVVVVLMAVIGGVVLTSIVRAMTISVRTEARFDGLADLQMTADRMTRELRAADPLHLTQSSATRAIVDTYRNNFSEHLRFTYQYCPAQGRIHVHRQGPTPAPAGPVVALDCATTTAPVLVDGVANGGQPMFQYLTGALTPTTVAAEVEHIRLTVRRSLTTPPALSCDPATDDDCIQVTTIVQVRNAQ